MPFPLQIRCISIFPPHHSDLYIKKMKLKIKCEKYIRHGIAPPQWKYGNTAIFGRKSEKLKVH